MTTRSETFSGQREFQIPGRYFELLSVVNPVDVTFFDRDGNIIAVEKQVSAGHWIHRQGFDLEGRPVVPFVRFEITTGASELVKFTATDGMSGSRVTPAAVQSTVQPAGLSHTNATATVTSTSSTILAANTSRRHLQIQNQDNFATVWLTSDGDAAVKDSTSIRLLPGETYAPLVAPLGAIKAIGDVASNPNVNVTEA